MTHQITEQQCNQEMEKMEEVPWDHEEHNKTSQQVQEDSLTEGAGYKEVHRKSACRAVSVVELLLKVISDPKLKLIRSMI